MYIFRSGCFDFLGFGCFDFLGFITKLKISLPFNELLDSALDDFHNLNLTSPQKSLGEKREDKSSSSGAVQGLLGGLPDLKSKNKGKQQQPKKKENHVVEAFEKLNKQTREAVLGLESTTAGAASKMPNLGVDGLGKEDGMMDEWVKQFEEMAGSQLLVPSINYAFNGIVGVGSGCEIMMLLVLLVAVVLDR
ncbi:hypothetical protein MKW94_017126 [Papaver nudicaule]|uniref:Uncharacterized protein n=1 Tax=Papaver nudicaule TaxID=74823 RepID=A0AA41SKL7_PAPNU|nr:hypothetical protein [Papaver nudicaule]